VFVLVVEDGHKKLVMRKNTNQIRIENLSKKRDEYLKLYEESEEDMSYPKEIDELSDEIIDRIKTWKDSLPFEFIIEELTKLGWAPCLLYDDNGNFAVTGEGMQSVPGNGVSDVYLEHWVKEECWKPTIREALNYYLNEE
jgi:hypothetical protein